MNKAKKLLALLLAAVLCFALISGCAGKTDEVTEPTNTVAPTAEVSDTPLVVAYDPFSAKFSPFYADTDMDMDVVEMTQLTLMTTDRAGGIIYNAIEGETTAYNGVDYTYTGPADIAVIQNADGSTTYSIHLRDDIKFSDGEPMTIDDVIFTYYVLCDPSYVGSTTLNSYNIIGLKEYQTQTSTALYDKYAAIFDDNYENGGDYADEVDAAVTAAWKDDVQAIVDFCLANYLNDYAEAATGHTPDEVMDSEGLQVAFGMWAWGYADGLGEDGLFYDSDGNTWDLATTYPTIDDYYQLCYERYEGDCVAYWATEQADGTDVYNTARDAFVTANAVNDADYEGAVTSIAGIQRIDDYTCEVTTSDFSAPAVYSICGIQVAPLHYYGDASMYDYDNNQFGFTFGDLSSVQAMTTQPMGAGPYKFVKYENKVVYFEANENYYKGTPLTNEVQFIETAEADKISGIAAGTIDISNPSGSKDKFEEIRSANSNGEVSGDTLTVDSVDNLGYGYIGMNADTVNVGGDPSSDASKDLRLGLATILAAYRDLAIDSYYGDAATVINYPISNTSWAAPRSADSDYQLAYSMDVDGNAIYTSTMSADEKYDAALQATIGYLKAAGYTWDDASGTFTAAPEGAKLVYEALIPGDGTGDHPSFTILTNASEALKSIGITLTVTDLTDSAVLWDRLDASTQEIWCAAWVATIDPDMYQVYHSSNIIGLGGSDSNHYHIADAALDELILQARTSADQEFRKSVYKQCLDIILDWAVEVPIYQRQNVFVYSTERVNVSTITPDVTTYWSWMNEVEKIQMN